MSTKSGRGAKSEAKRKSGKGAFIGPLVITLTVLPPPLPSDSEDLPGPVLLTSTPPLARASKASPKWFYPLLLHPHLSRLVASLSSSSSTFFSVISSRSGYCISHSEAGAREGGVKRGEELSKDHCLQGIPNCTTSSSLASTRI